MWKDEWVIFKSIIGSTAYGVAGPDSDVDVRGVFLPPTSLVLGLNKPNDTHEDIKGGNDIVFKEFENFLRLTLNQNPNWMEVLWSPLVEYSSPLMDEFLAKRQLFLSRKLIVTYLGYGKSQLTKMANHPQWPWKHGPQSGLRPVSVDAGPDLA
jgi:predicted nucleotidyltransferase